MIERASGANGGVGLARIVLALVVVAGLVPGFAPALGTSASADEVVIRPDRDNSMYSDSGDLSNGAGEHLFAGRVGTMGGGALRRALLHFDVTEDIPAGSIVTSAVLEMTVTNSVSGNQTTALYLSTSDWGEGASDAGGPEGTGGPAETGDATWTHRFYDTDLWGALGGDLAASPSAIAPSGSNGSVTQWGSTVEMVADVQSWLDDRGGNFGWVVVGNEVTMHSAKRYGSRENALASERPTLTIEFTPPGGIPTVSQWGLAVMSMALVAAGTVVYGRSRRTATVGN
jgi:hypothetical protein